MSTHFFAVLLSFAVVVYSEPLNNAELVTIQSINYSGSGCPSSSVSYLTSSDKTSFTVVLASFEATLGSGVAPTENTKNCQLAIDVAVPNGVQYAVSAVDDVRGFYQLDTGVKATQTSSYSFAPGGQVVSFGSSFTGPATGQNYARSDSVPPLVWSACGGATTLNIEIQASLSNTSPTAQGQITVDSQDGKFTTTTSFVSQRCTST